MLLMLRHLLAERFQLRVTEGEKKQPVYALVAAPGGIKLKPRPAGQRCPEGVDSASMKVARAPGSFLSSFNGCTLAELVAAFNRPARTRQIGRLVVDRTGLTGSYYMLVWEPIAPGTRFTTKESFREAVEKELGLKLVDATATVHYIHVVSVARPGPD
jgi:uncharacterized protein (TIGR03435 family)